MTDKTNNQDAATSSPSAIEKLNRLRDETTARYEKEQTDLLAAGLLPTVEDLIPATGTFIRCPTLLTRTPLFSVSQERAKLDTGWETGQRMETPWVNITRWGPGLTTYDEDTFFGMLNVCWQRKLKGPRKAMPAPTPRLMVVESNKAPVTVGEMEETTVVTGETTAYQINQFIRRELGGDHLERTRASIKRLAKNVFLFEREDLRKEGIFHLFRYIGDMDARGEILIQFDPVIVMLMASATYINMDVRHELKPIGKALHRFLSSQVNSKQPRYEIGLEKLMRPIGYTDEMKYFKRSANIAMNKLVDLGWLSSFDIAGTGRSSPLKLILIKKSGGLR